MAHNSLIPELERAIKSHDSQRRTTILSRVADLFRNAKIQDENDERLGLFDDVFAQLVKDMTTSALAKLSGECSDCGKPATWLWISRREVSNLDQTERIETSPGALFCAKHGAAKLCEALGQVPEANLFYINAPYGDSGAYVWI